MCIRDRASTIPEKSLRITDCELTCAVFTGRIRVLLPFCFCPHDVKMCIRDRGALTDFGPMLRNLRLSIFGAAAQLGIFTVLLCAVMIGLSLIHI